MSEPIVKTLIEIDIQNKVYQYFHEDDWMLFFSGQTISEAFDNLFKQKDDKERILEIRPDFASIMYKKFIDMPEGRFFKEGSEQVTLDNIDILGIPNLKPEQISKYIIEQFKNHPKYIRLKAAESRLDRLKEYKRKKAQEEKDRILFEQLSQKFSKP